MNTKKYLLKLMDNYNLNNLEKNEIIEIIYPIIVHPEFQKRLTKEFMHHGEITLGEHIIKDTIKTYLLCKKYNKKRKNKVNIELALKISMLHDLYTSPWQNSKERTKFFHKHGFRHPIEAVINAAFWFPEYFKNKKDTEIIIDGIIHHMYPLPVTSIKSDEINKIELHNLDIFLKLDKDIRENILKSIKRKRIYGISFSRSLYKEGRIMSKADKKVALSEIKNFSSAKALLTGKNKKIKKGK